MNSPASVGSSACPCAVVSSAAKKLECDVAAAGPHPINQFIDAFRRKPATPARRNQHGAFDISRNPAQRRADEEISIIPRDMLPEEFPLIQVPQAAVADRRGETVIECDSRRENEDCN